MDASVNKIIDACVDDFKMEEKIVIHKKDKNEINIVVRVGLEKYDKK